MLFLSVFRELVALSRTKFVPRISAFLCIFLECIHTYSSFRGRKEAKLCVSAWVAKRLQVFQQSVKL